MHRSRIFASSPRPTVRSRPPVGGRTVVVATAAALLLASLLNPSALTRPASAMAFGWQRVVALGLSSAVSDVSHALWLDRPRAALDRLFASGSDATRPTTPATIHVRTPTRAAPLRVYVAGDSVSQSLGDAFARLASATGVVSTRLEYRYSTGLSRPDYFNWPARLRLRMSATPRPEVVIVMFGANDVQGLRTATGVAFVGTRAWLAEYRRRVAATMSLLVNSGADVYWVGQPIMQSATFARRIAELDAIYRSEAAAHRGVTYIDGWSLFADASGHYSAYLPDAAGRLVRVRAPDGIHLTVAGGERLARRVLARIEQRWHFPR